MLKKGMATAGQVLHIKKVVAALLSLSLSQRGSGCWELGGVDGVEKIIEMAGPGLVPTWLSGLLKARSGSEKKSARSKVKCRMWQ
ncbi:hypothetical protein B0T18DRAFT_420493 [Schizothecium vesticola]|uniref:Uncharacterized protein n=1 Tax=Schizothecium vesticola TaxID=314040 RepID=A0AA40BNZ3_9PEZI|nr:hypothetical protein B0T18DRAFT_420493 [Schizothecium vesticola]